MRYFFCLLICFSISVVSAQDSLDTKMEWYGKIKPTSNLFVHFDKNVYSNNETIWFTGYLLKYKPQIHKDQVLILALVSAIDSALIIEDRFLIQNGFAYGSMLIPDSLITGDYNLVAFTNGTLNNQPVDIFNQPITIKTKIDPAFNAVVKLQDSSATENKVLISLNQKNGKRFDKVIDVSYRYGNEHRQTKMGPSGQLMLTLPHNVQLADPNLYVKIKPGKDSANINIPLPQPKGKALVKFYPEGGHLVANTSSTVGFEIKDQFNRPVQTSALLYRNNEIIDTISTGSYGMGKFKLFAGAGNYHIKLVHSGFLDSIYQLPKIISNGLNISIQNAVAEDTLRLELKSFSHKKLSIRIHNLRTSFFYQSFELDNPTQRVKIALSDIPKGVAAITIADSIGRPLAERLFFAHYDSSNNLILNIDKKIYQQREKVTLNLNIGPSIKLAAVSIACVQENRLNLKKRTDIENFTYLNNELSALPVHANGNGLADKNYLDYILLIKGWRKYTWQEMIELKNTDTLVQHKNLGIGGLIWRGKKVFPGPVGIGTIGNKKPTLLTTIDGSFKVNPEILLTPYGKKMYVVVNDQAKLDYLITIKDDILPFTSHIIKNIARDDSQLPSAIPNTDELVINRKEKSISLREVVVTNNKYDQGFNYEVRKGKRKKNECGDYVCSFGILNCPNHFDDQDNVEPTPGQSYQIVPGNEDRVTYTKCVVYKQEDLKYFIPINPIHEAKEFYENDYKDPQEPAFASTLYWNYSTVLNNNKTTTLHFYTSDITGKFKIIVQGLADKDVIYAEQTFEVTGKK